MKCIDDEIPFEIPKGWEWVRLKGICSMRAGKNISASKIYTEMSNSNPYRCVGGNGLRGFTSIYNTSGNYPIIGRQGALCGCLNIENGNFYATEHAVIVDSFNMISPMFMYYFLTALNLNQYATATAQPGLAVSKIIDVLCPLPPLTEHNRIVNVIEKIIPQIDNYEKAQYKLNQLNTTLKTAIKKSILQEAIQGKLVPQDSNDEPASVLLERIRTEKERLIKEKKIKRDKNESIIYKGDDNSYYEKLTNGTVICIDEEIPFEIPKSWNFARMGSIGDWGSGSTPSKTRCDYYNGNVLWLRTGELNNSIVYDTEIKITEKAVEECSFRMNMAGDILIAMYGATIGKVAIAGKSMTTNQACCGCTPFLIYNKYLFYFLMASKEEFIRKGEGGAQPNISRDKLVRHVLSVPPLQEQFRIVEEIEKLLDKFK